MHLRSYLLSIHFIAVLAAPALSATFTVNSAGDTSDANLGNGICADGGGLCTLRSAVQEANSGAALDTIEFDIPSSDPNCALVTGHGTVCTISLSTQVDVVFPVAIDGFTQDGSSANTNPTTAGSNAVLLIELMSPNPPGSGNAGLVFGSNSSGSTVRGLVMNRFANSPAIQLIGGDNNIIEGNYFGTDPKGTISLANGEGVRIASGADNNLIGGTLASARNVISDSSIGIRITVNCTGNTVQGNFVGTNAAGSAALASVSGSKGISIENNSPNTTIGGDTVVARNVIVPGAQGDAIDISNTHAGVSIRGNFIGTDLTGTVRLENSSRAINNLVTTGVTVGGPTATPGTPPGNLIASGNFGIGGQTVNNLTVKGNLIGTNSAGAVLPYLVPPIGVTTYGISLNDGTGAVVGGTAAGEGNVIAGHTDAGVKSTVGGAIGIAIVGNSIHSNGIFGAPSGLGIDLGAVGVSPNDACDASHPQNSPVITSATFGTGDVTLSGTLNSVANTTFRLEFFSNSSFEGSQHGEGRTLIGTTQVTTDGSCEASFGPLTFSRSIGQNVVSSTATRLDVGGVPTLTSEFSQNVFIAPTAADVSISGRVSTVKGIGIASVRVTIADSNGVTETTVTNSNGDYQFDEVPAGSFYVLTASAKGYTFTGPQVIAVSDSMTDVDFIGDTGRKRSRASGPSSKP